MLYLIVPTGTGRFNMARLMTYTKSDNFKRLAGQLSE